MIPHTFALMGQTIRVVTRDDLMVAEAAFGQYDTNRLLIELQTPGAGVSADVITQTFWHEWWHAFCDAIGEDELFKNEKLADLFGQCMKQTIQSIEFASVSPPPPKRKRKART